MLIAAIQIAYEVYLFAKLIACLEGHTRRDAVNKIAAFGIEPDYKLIFLIMSYKVGSGFWRLRHGFILIVAVWLSVIYGEHTAIYSSIIIKILLKAISKPVFHFHKVKKRISMLVALAEIEHPRCIGSHLIITSVYSISQSEASIRLSSFYSKLLRFNEHSLGVNQFNIKNLA